MAGNHDYAEEWWHFNRYGGPNWYSFQFYDDLFIILNGTWDNWNIQGRQWDYLTKTLSSKGSSANRVFILVHQLIWQPGDERFATVKLNDPNTCPDTTNFRSTVEPLLKKRGLK